MVFRGYTVKVLLILVTLSPIKCLPSNPIDNTPNEMPTRLLPVRYGPFSYTDDDDNKSLLEDTTAQESIKIENRQLYDIVKHASGYDPEANTNITRTATEETNDKLNTSSVKIFVPPRKSAVIQAIPRKVRGPGIISTSTTTSAPFARPPKDYGTGEPTTTIVYATSIPTTSSRTFVNIRPVPLLSTQKYRATIVETKQEKHQDRDANTKPVVENLSGEQQLQQQEQKFQMNVVLEKPVFKIDSNQEQGTTTPSSYETTPYHIEQRKRNLYKSLPYARIRMNEDIDEMRPYQRSALLNPYPNHKWTNEDYNQRIPLSATSQQFIYENNQNLQPNYYNPPAIPSAFSSQYSTQDEYPMEMYSNPQSPVYMPQPQLQPQPQPIGNVLPQQQLQRQQYQPLSVRDFDLLLQLLVLRERRLNGPPEPYSSPTDYNGGIQQDSNYYYDMSKATLPENQYFKPKYDRIENSMPRSNQPSNNRLLPSNVREELLFRMLLLALHLQPQPKSVPLVRSSPVLPPQYMYLAPPSSQQPSSQPSSQFLGFRHRNGIPKSPVRSVQVLGEIE